VRVIVEGVPKWALVAGAALLLFVILAGSRWLLTPRERGAVSVQQTYDELAAALEQEKLLPLQDEDTLLMAFANLMIGSGQLNEPQSTGSGALEVKLGQVLRAVIINGQVSELWLEPPHWREVRAGDLRETLHAISRLPLRKQAGTSQAAGRPAGQATNFSFTAMAGSEVYTFTPYFQGQNCSQILVKR
jgi:hypothetical protein